MFDIGWTELLVIAIVMIVVVGPKDLPPMLRAFGKMTGNLRKMAGDFRAQFEEALKETELDDVRKTITDAHQNLNPTNALRDAINPLRQMGQDLKNDLQRATQVPSPEPTVSLAAEPGQGDPLSTPIDAEAQKAVEGSAVAAPAAEVPANAAAIAQTAHAASPAVSAPAAPLAAAPTTPVSSAPLAPVSSEASAKPVAAKGRAKKKAETEVEAPVVEELAVEKPKRVRKVAAKAETVEIAAPAVTKAKTPRKPKAVAEAAPVVEAAGDTQPATEKVPARKRAAKKTDTPKGEA